MVSGALVAFALSAVVALVDRGARRAWAGGMAAVMTAYGLALLLSTPVGATIAENREFNPSTGQLPTSRLLGRLYEQVAHLGWVDVRTGKPADEAPANATLNSGDSTTTTSGEIPDRETFMVIGHTWCTIALGLVGGCVSRTLYRKCYAAPEA
jgi:hypothetical protein